MFYLRQPVIAKPAEAIFRGGGATQGPRRAAGS
jgi:hypothetical protein